MNSIKSVNSEVITFSNEKGLWHREDGPARIWTSEDRKGDEFWFWNGKAHRVGGPSDKWLSLRWKNSARVSKYEWQRHGNRHRLNAPAVIFFDNSKFYYEFGIKIL